MIPRSWRKWLEDGFPFLKYMEKRRPQNVHLMLEVLEDRWVPATFNVLTGADGVGLVTPNGSNFDATTLRAAVNAAQDTNFYGASSTINLPVLAGNAHYLLTDVNGELQVKHKNPSGPALNLTVQTSGSGMAVIDGQKMTRLFEVIGTGAYGGNTLNLINLQLTGGKVVGSSDGVGGAIENDYGGVLNIQKSKLLNNEADGQSFTDSTNSGGNGFGGAIYNAGDLTIADSTFSGNIARGGSVDYAGNSFHGGKGLGGAIFLAGGESVSAHTIKITGSTFADNKAIGGNATQEPVSSNDGSFTGGEGRGGAIFRDNSRQNLTIANSTFAKISGGNQAIGGNAINNASGPSGPSGSSFIAGSAYGGALDLHYGSGASGPSGTNINLTHDTIADNSTKAGTVDSVLSLNDYGGGIFTRRDFYLGNAPQLLNTLLARNSSTHGPDESGTINSLGHNLINNSNGSDVSPSGFSSAKQDIIGGTGGVPNLNLDATLKDNGGPTQTLALQAGSAAIDKGDDASTVTGPPGVGPLSTDQRGTGHPRKVGVHVDIGAFEFQPPTPPKKRGRSSFP